MTRPLHIAITPQGVLDYHHCPHLWEYRWLCGLAWDLGDMEGAEASLAAEGLPATAASQASILANTARSRALHQFVRQAGLLEKLPPRPLVLTAALEPDAIVSRSTLSPEALLVDWQAPVAALKDGWILLFRRVSSGVSLDAAESAVAYGTETALHLAIAQAAMAEPPTPRPIKGAVVFLIKPSMARPRFGGGETPQGFQARVLQDMDAAPLADHVRRVPLPLDGRAPRHGLSPLGALQDAQHLLEYTTGLIAARALRWTSDPAAFPALRGDRCRQHGGSSAAGGLGCEFRSLCWSGEMEGYVFNDGKSLADPPNAWRDRLSDNNKAA